MTIKYTRLNPFISKIISHRLLNLKGSTKSTYHIALCLKGSGLGFLPGDAIGILPKNSKDLAN